MNNYHQITEKERYIISHLSRQRFTPSQIAREIGRHRSSITRQFKRNCNRAGVYRPGKDQEKTNGRRSCSRKMLQYTKEQMEDGMKVYPQVPEPRTSLRKTQT